MKELSALNQRLSGEKDKEDPLFERMSSAYTEYRSSTEEAYEICANYYRLRDELKMLLARLTDIPAILDTHPEELALLVGRSIVILRLVDLSEQADRLLQSVESLFGTDVGGQDSGQESRQDGEEDGGQDHGEEDGGQDRGEEDGENGGEGDEGSDHFRNGQVDQALR